MTAEFSFVGIFAAATLALGLHYAPCAPLGPAKLPAKCGTLGVYENRTMKSGRIIGVHFVLIPAKHPSGRAITDIAGGPGEAATPYAADVAQGLFDKPLLALNDTYDLLFFDDRGMGQSHPFACDLTPKNDPAAYFAELFPQKIVAACRTANAATHDLAKYNTTAAVDDLDDLRAALGENKLVVHGGSYGTLFAMVYMRRHPEHVESAILDGVGPPHFQPLPGEPLGAQHALDDLVAKCRTDAVCNEHFPHFGAHFAAIVQRLSRGPLMVPAWSLPEKRERTVRLTKQVFVDQVRHILYNPFGASYLPYVIERAYGGDYAPLGRMIETVSLGFGSDINFGAFFSYSCADMMPFISEAQVRYAAAHAFGGDLRIRAQQKACATWNVPAMPASFNDALRSDLPVLMILGSDDPATPAKYGLEALKYLPNGRAVLVRGGGHGADTDCTDALELRFVRERSAKNLDVSKCTATFKLPPFATSMKSWPSF